MPTYDQLVRDYHALAFKVARSVVRDDASAEDVVQDVYLRFLRDPAVLERAENLKAFVARAAVNAALDLKRGAGRREKHERASFERRAAMSPIDAAARAELRSKVGELPDGERLAVEMHYFHGLTKGETAAALQVPEGTVSSRLNAGLARLRQLLAGAAFAGLLAMLESELSKCAADDAVPGNLGERLMRLPKGSSAGPAPAVVSRKLATGAAATAVALFLAMGTAKWMQTRAAAGEKAPETAVAPEVAASTPTKTTEPGAGTTGTPTSTAAATAPAADEVVVEGWLFRRGEGFFVRDVDLFDGHAGQTVFNREIEEEKRWKESLTLTDAKGLPAVEPCTFVEFLEHDGRPEEAPRSYVRVRFRGVARPGPAPDSDEESFGARNFPPLAVPAAEILSSEVLSTAWLLAWRDMLRAYGEFGSAWSLEPGSARRSGVLDAATHFAQAWEAARASRRGESPADWRIRNESEVGCALVGSLRTVGLDHILPAMPSAEELHDLLMEAGSAKALRDAAVSKWGEEALYLYVGCYRGNESEWSWISIPLVRFATMDEAEFSALRKELDAIAENRRDEPDPAVGRQRRADARAAIAARGLAVADLSSIDRERFIVDQGARVESVEAGSAADRAGLKPGDILWKATIEFEGKSEHMRGEVPVNGEVGLGALLEGRDALPLRVVRPDGIADVELAR